MSTYCFLSFTPHAFTGEAGQKLDELLTSAGLPQRDCRSLWLENSPQGKTRSSYITEGTLLESTTEHFDQLVASLAAQVAEIQPRILIPLDGPSLKACTGLQGHRARRGSLLTGILPGCEHIPVLPTHSPATALRHGEPLNHFIIQLDLLKVAAFLKGQLPPQQEPILLLDPPFEEVLAFLAECGQAKEVGFDIETSTARLRGDRFTREMTTFSIAIQGKAMAVPVSCYGSNAHRWSLEEERQILQALFTVLTDPAVVKIGQNLSYDASFLYHRYGVPLWPFEDTMMGSRITSPDFPANLGFLCSIHTAQPYYKDLAGAGTEDAFLRYSALDAAVVLEIWPKILRDLTNQRNLPAYQRARDSFQLALFIQEHGLPLDTVTQTTIRRQVEAEMRGLQKEIDQAYLAVCEKNPEWVAEVEKQKADLAVAKTKKRSTKGREEKLAALHTLNVQSPQQLCAFLYGKKPTGLGLPPLLSNGRMTVDDDARKRLIGKGVTVVKSIDSLIRCSKDLGKYWKVPTDPDGRLRCMMATTGTDSGRWSSQVSLFSTGCQFQNMPKRFKPLLVAEPTRPFIQMDLAQAENRIVAVLAQDARMMEAFEKGLDVHRLTAALMFGKRPEDISDQPGSSLLGDGKHSERDWGKRANHAFNYGLGVNMAAEHFEVSARDARFLHTAYHRSYPGVRNTFWGMVKQRIRETRFLENLLGRRRLYLLPLSGENEKSAYSFIPQSTIPDILMEWVALPTYREEGEAVSLVNHVHDSLEYQYHLAEREESLPGMATFLHRLAARAAKPLTYLNTTFFIPADFKVGWSLGKMYDVKLSTPEETAIQLERILFQEHPHPKGAC